MKTVTLQEKYNREKFEILLENLDQNEIRKIGQTFGELNRILGDANIPSIKNIIQQANKEIADLQSGGFFKQITNAVTLNMGQRRTMSSIVSLQTQLVSMFRMLPDLMNIAGSAIDKAMKKKPEKVTGLEGKEQQESLMDALGNDPALQNLQKMIIKALKPDAITGLFNNQKLDPEKISEEILRLPLDEFRDLAKRASGVKLQVPIEKEDVEQLKGAEEKSNASDVFSKMSAQEAEGYMKTISFLEKVGQKINPDIKKALEARVRATQGSSQKQSQQGERRTTTQTIQAEHKKKINRS
jgi:hypothetical protein